MRRGEVDLAANADRPTAPEIRADRVAETQHVIVVRWGHPLTHVETVTAARSAADEYITVSRRGKARQHPRRRSRAARPHPTCGGDRAHRKSRVRVRARLRPPRHSPRIHGAFGRRRSRPDPATAPVRPATRRSQPTPTSDGEGMQVPASRIAKWRLSEPHVVSTAGTRSGAAGKDRGFLTGVGAPDPHGLIATDRDWSAVASRRHTCGRIKECVTNMSPPASKVGSTLLRLPRAARAISGNTVCSSRRPRRRSWPAVPADIMQGSDEPRPPPVSCRCLEPW
ncbi:LysR substrate-binding domain-containing protein [Nocardia gipuzkoensis]|uniref:LysR substrate-binding domain-containing protein n=1 Tax=Nocardia gipuzkoensis TaxID=2749991 RepID=UPI003B8A648F